MTWQFLKSAVKYISESVEDMAKVASQTDLATDYSRTKYTTNRNKNNNEPEYNGTKVQEYENIDIYKFLTSW
jgi:hypothetical protein